MPLSEVQISRIHSLLRHHAPSVQAQGRELLVTLAHERDDLRSLNLAGMNLSHINLAERDLRDINLTGAQLLEADLRGADLRGAILDGVDLSEARLEGADLSRTSMRNATLSGAGLTGANLTLLDLRGARVRCALPADARVFVNRKTEHLGLPPDAIQIDAATDQPGLDLAGLTLTDMHLEDSDLRGADLSGGCFRRARLSHCDLTGANLSGAALHRARLRNAWLRGADLSGADLSVADLTGADLTGADLSGTDLTGANLTAVIGADLSGAKTDGGRREESAPLADITPAARLAQLCTDPDWTLRRLGLLYQARTGDAAAALTGFIAAENTTSASDALITVLDRFTVADLAALPESYPQRRLILTMASLREEQSAERIVEMVRTRFMERAIPLRFLIESISPEIWPEVRGLLRSSDSSYPARKLNGSLMQRDRPLPDPVPPRPILHAQARDATLPEPIRRRALFVLLKVKLVDAETRELLIHLISDPNIAMAILATAWLGDLMPDEALLGLISEAILREDKVGTAAITTLVALAARHPAHAESIIDTLLPLIDLPLEQPRGLAVRQGLFGLIKISSRPDRDLLLKRCGLTWRTWSVADRTVTRLRTRDTNLIDHRMLPQLLSDLWGSPGSPRVAVLATAPDVALPIAAENLAGPWSARTRVALRLCKAIGPAAVPLVPQIRLHLFRPDLPNQRAAAAALGAIGDPVALPWLARLSQTPDRHLRRVAVRALVALAEADIA